MLARALAQARPTCWCSTSRPTISTSKRSTCCRRCSATIGHACCWSATTAISSTGSSNAVIAAEGDGRWIEYAGGYSDMVAQRGRGVAALPQRLDLQAPSPGGTGASGPRAARPAPGSEQRRRLSNAEQHALKTSPARIAALNAEQVAVWSVCSPIPISMQATARATPRPGRILAKIQVELAAAEEEWLRLELLREEIERA